LTKGESTGAGIPYAEIQKKLTRAIDKIDLRGYYTFYATLIIAASRAVPAVRRVAGRALMRYPRWRGRGAIAIHCRRGDNAYEPIVAPSTVTLIQVFERAPATG